MARHQIIMHRQVTAPPPGYGQPPAYGQQPGYGQPYGYPGMAPVAPQTNGLAVTSLVLGILSFFTNILTGIPAVITGHMALGRIKQNPAMSGRGLAITGLVLGYLSIAFFVVIILLVIIGASIGTTVVTTTTP